MALRWIMGGGILRAREASAVLTFWGWAAITFLCVGPGRAQDVATNASTGSMGDTVRSLLAESSQELAAGDDESAIRDASTAIQLDPHNASAYELRGSIYIEEKLWDRAERDYTSASKISPDVVYKYKLAEIRFLAKAYEDARPQFAALENDSHLGDLATYKAFLCDLLGYHEAASLRDLADLDQRPHAASYYFCHAAWDLYHGQRAEGAKYFSAAGQIYDRATTDLYIASLMESRRFQLGQATFVTRDGTPYNQVSVFLEDDGLHVSTENGWMTLPLAQLPDDLSGFPEEVREQIGRRHSVTSEAPMVVSLVSFTTQSGRTYHDVRWSMEDSGLLVLTDDGWIAVPFADLPTDLSSLPNQLQQAIAQRRLLPMSTLDRMDVVSFTTRHGKTYTEARAFLAHDGLRLLTADGWITVGFSDLPEIVSPFPAEWRAQIQAGRTMKPPDPSGMEVVSFTTRMGKHYDQVRAALGSSGLRLVTPEGWIEVPFRDLPKDVSALPEEWAETITAKQTVMLKDKAPSL
jgi:hypothetical protein